MFLTFHLTYSGQAGKEDNELCLISILILIPNSTLIALILAFVFSASLRTGSSPESIRPSPSSQLELARMGEKDCPLELKCIVVCSFQLSIEPGTSSIG